MTELEADEQIMRLINGEMVETSESHVSMEDSEEEELTEYQQMQEVFVNLILNKLGDNASPREIHLARQEILNSDEKMKAVLEKGDADQARQRNQIEVLLFRKIFLVLSKLMWIKL